MKTVDEAVDHYWPVKQSGKMSLQEIRIELETSTQFSAEKINSVCAKISQLDIDHVGGRSTSRFQVSLSYFFLVLWTLTIVILCYLRSGIYQIKDVPFWVLITGAAVLALKNTFTVLKFHLTK